ncbi:tetratricopeptide repeat protein [Candidatus Marithrix sp. Canyon 246]|uniref:tetratricopeptide repeat protein n=1 Tax=Candidatus Marithrix sp. Canyon 246 TaxID=1827136 RepID=UPI00210FEB09|nr:tetratricopeptide repeat protein [Candidatus Marithrix sp. Canyon 246]
MNVLGVRHKDTLLLANDLGLIYKNSNKFAEALDLFESIYPISTAEFGKKDSDTIIIMSHLATVYQDLGQLKNSFRFAGKG